MSNNRKLVLFIACSFDGFIAKPGDDLSFLSLIEKPGEDYGYSVFYHTVDTVIMGRKTYDWVMKQVEVFPHAHLTSYIITHNPRPSDGKINLYHGDLKELVLKLKNQGGKNIFVDGGAEIVNELLKEKLIDELIVSVIPILLGDGVRLFKDGRPEQKLQLVSVKNFESGLVQFHYKTLAS